MYEIERKSQCHFCVLGYFKKEFFFWNNIFEKRLSKYIKFEAMEKHAMKIIFLKDFNSKVGPKI